MLSVLGLQGLKGGAAQYLSSRLSCSQLGCQGLLESALQLAAELAQLGAQLGACKGHGAACCLKLGQLVEQPALASHVDAAERQARVDSVRAAGVSVLAHGKEYEGAAGHRPGQLQLCRQCTPSALHQVLASQHCSLTGRLLPPKMRWTSWALVPAHKVAIRHKLAAHKLHVYAESAPVLRTRSLPQALRSWPRFSAMGSLVMLSTSPSW